MPEETLHHPALPRNEKIFLFTFSFLFLALNAIFTYLGYWQLNFLPLVLILMAATMWSLKRGFFLVVALTPLSLPLNESYSDLGFNLSIPSEPLMILLLILIILKSIHEGLLPESLVKHPFTLLILFHILWMLITSFTSTMPLVSMKYLTARIWFVAVFFILGVLIFMDPRHIRNYFFAYISGMAVVVGYALYNHFIRGFLDQEAAHGVANPFFNDHTSFGAALAMLLPPMVVFTYRLRGWKQLLLGLSTLVFLLAFVFSYSRAAWLSLFIAAVVFIIIKLKVKFGILLSISILLLLALVFYWPRIQMRMEQNRQDSSARLAQHVQSIYNISSDASNLERINRWKSALRMAGEKPLFGWGPGTYMFRYAGWQHSRDRTIISTNFGDQGNAHSEYLGPLAESGLPGMLAIILIMAYGLYLGFRNYQYGSNSLDNQLLLAVCLGLITYIVHGFLNNFLDTDKASALFWGYLAIVLAYDLQANPVKRGSSAPITGS